ncbi:MAG TPA: YtxH domain-containing protein [Bryobacteraceae bacterium]|nr:YtxH domain-containing protein [Bryobacteraceae bacterium]
MDDDKRLPYFFLGLGIGCAVGILFAPKSGEETREMLLTKAGEGKDVLRRHTEELRGSATELIDRGKSSASELIDRGKNVVARQKEQLSSAVEAGKQAYREAVASGGNAEL